MATLKSTNRTKPALNSPKSPLTRAAQQKMLRSVAELKIGYDDWKFEEIDTVDSVDVSIYCNPNTGKKVMFTIDPEDQEVIFYKKLKEQTTTVPVVNDVTAAKTFDDLSSNDELVLSSGYYHPMATTLFSLSEEKQKQWWKEQKLWVPYDGESYMMGKVIGFQKTDTGHIGAIVADRHNTRILYGMSFKSGTPFILGRPKPRKND